MTESLSRRLQRARSVIGCDSSVSARSRHQGTQVRSSSLGYFFESAGLCFPGSAFLAALMVAIILLCLCGWQLVGISVLLFPPLLLGAGYFFIRHRQWERIFLFERDYPAFLLALASSIRTGLDPLIAFSGSQQMFGRESVLGREIQRTSEAIESGVEEERAFLDFAKSINHPDIKLLRVALVLSRRQGASLGACLQRLARVTRQRQSFRRKIRGAVAMQRLSAFGIAGCTAIVGVIQVTSNPAVIQVAWAHPTGGLVLFAGLSLVAGGLIWMIIMSRRNL